MLKLLRWGGKTIVLSCFTVSAFAADLSTYFFPKGIFETYVTKERLGDTKRRRYNNEIEAFPVYVNFKEGNSTKEIVEYWQFKEALDLILKTDPEYFDKIEQKPERIQIDIYQRSNSVLFDVGDEKKVLLDRSALEKAVEKMQLYYKQNWVPYTDDPSEDKKNKLKAARDVYALLNQNQSRSTDTHSSFHSPVDVNALAMAVVFHSYDKIKNAEELLPVAQLIEGFDFSSLKRINQLIAESDKLDIKEVGKLIAQLKKSRAVFEPIDSIQEKQRFRLTEYPMHLSVYRGGCVNDCSTDSSRFFILMPNEFTFYVERINKGGSSEFIGYVSASLVFADGEKTLLIKDVAGSKSLDTYFLKEVIEGFMSLKEYYGVKRIALMSTDFVKNNHDSKQVKALRDFINTYTLEQANYVRFPDNKLRLALEKYNKYDLERYHQRINIINEKLVAKKAVVTRIEYKELSTNNLVINKRPEQDKTFSLSELEFYIENAILERPERIASIEKMLAELHRSVERGAFNLDALISLLKKYKVEGVDYSRKRRLYLYPELLFTAKIFDSEGLTKAYEYITSLDLNNDEVKRSYLKILELVEEKIPMDPHFAHKLIKRSLNYSEADREELVEILETYFFRYSKASLSRQQKKLVLDFLNTFKTRAQTVFSFIVQRNLYPDERIPIIKWERDYNYILESVFPNVLSYFDERSVFPIKQLASWNWKQMSLRNMFYIESLVNRIIKFQDTDNNVVKLWSLLRTTKAGPNAVRDFVSILSFLEEELPPQHFYKLKAKLKRVDEKWFTKNKRLLDSVFSQNQKIDTERRNRLMNNVLSKRYPGSYLSNREFLELIGDSESIDPMKILNFTKIELERRYRARAYFSATELRILDKLINRNKFSWNAAPLLRSYQASLIRIHEAHNWEKGKQSDKVYFCNQAM